MIEVLIKSIQDFKTKVMNTGLGEIKRGLIEAKIDNGIPCLRSKKNIVK